MSAHAPFAVVRPRPSQPRLVVTIHDHHLSLLAAERLTHALFDLTVDGAPADLDLDFTGVEYLTSAMLGGLVGLHTRLRIANRHLRLFNVQPQVYELFAITRLTELLDVRPAAAAV